MSATTLAPTRENARLAPGASHPGGPPRTGHRFHELDLLRLVAALAVVAFHYTFRVNVAQTPLADTGFTDPHRVARLYPAFWVACTITTLFTLIDPQRRLHVTFGQYLVNLTMAPEELGVPQVDGVYWTLLVELKFYALILVLCLIRMTRTRVLAFALGWLAVSIWHAIVPLPALLATLLIPDWSAFFIAGILFALIAREGWQARYTAPLVIAFVWSLRLAIRFAEGQSGKYGGELSPTVVALVITAIFGIFALIASHKLRAAWTARVAFLGALTYPLYLLHQNVGFVLFHLGHGFGLGRWTLAALVLGTVLAMSWTLHVLVERRFGPPLNRWIRARLVRLRTALTGVAPLDEVRHSDLPLTSAKL
jgi:peptidoglycan/LPS O-acetylase OafA/YrhL